VRIIKRDFAKLIKLAIYLINFKIKKSLQYICMIQQPVECIIDKIFGTPPKEPCTYIIDTEYNNINIVFLTHFMLAGARKLFGNVTPKTITEKQFNLLKEYMESVGYTIKYQFLEDRAKIWFEKYMKPTKCNGMLLR
jgi:hypothetical protein